jgi:hypothetical protein
MDGLYNRACRLPKCLPKTAFFFFLCVQARGQSATLFGAGRGPSGVAKSVLDTTRTDGGRRDEIFVDVVERLTATFNSTGYLQSSQIDGAIVVRLISPPPALLIA